MARTVPSGGTGTHGNSCAPTFRDERSTASPGNSVALAILNDEIQAFRMPRKALADECGKSEQTFSKMTGGSQAFGLDDFDQLPLDLRVQWVKRYGDEVLGLEVRERDLGEIAQEFHEMVDKLASISRLARIVGKPRMASASTRVREGEKVG